MATPIKFPGWNIDLGPPRNNEEEVSAMPCFWNGNCWVSKWELSDEDIAYIVQTRSIYVSVLTGNTRDRETGYVTGPYPLVIGNEQTVRGHVADYGPVWDRDGPLETPSPEPTFRDIAGYDPSDGDDDGTGSSTG